MSRTVIAAVVAVVIAALTAIAFFVTSTSFDERARKDADVQLTRAHQVVQQLDQLQGIDVSNKAERLAATAEFVNAIKTDERGRARSRRRGSGSRSSRRTRSKATSSPTSSRSSTRPGTSSR